MWTVKDRLKWITVFLVTVTVFVTYNWKKGILHQNYCNSTLWNDSWSEFEGFDNISGIGNGAPIIPNYVHFLRYGWWMEEMLLFDAACILAAFKNQKPDKIFFHSDLTNFTGKYWEKVISTPGLLDIVEFVPVDIPDEIFGQKFTDELNSPFHASDILRIRILMEYGGIYLDGDSYVVRNLDRYRCYEMALGWDEGELLGTQILVAHKDARFLKLWLESYRNNYYPNMWYFNAGEYPTRNILEYRPELVHRVKLLFGVQDLRGKIYRGFWPDWKQQYTIHVLTRHVDIISDYYYEKVEGPEDLTDQTIIKFGFTMRYMVEDVITLQEETLQK